jgi:hypothetical protein
MLTDKRLLGLLDRRQHVGAVKRRQHQRAMARNPGSGLAVSKAARISGRRRLHHMATKRPLQCTWGLAAVIGHACRVSRGRSRIRVPRLPALQCTQLQRTAPAGSTTSVSATTAVSITATRDDGAAAGAQQASRRLPEDGLPDGVMTQYCIAIKSTASASACKPMALSLFAKL